MITKSKWDYLRSYDGYAILFTEFTDGDYITDVQSLNDLESKIAGPRIKRNEFDEAPSVFIPLKHFISLSTWYPKGYQANGSSISSAAPAEGELDAGC